jgi:acyl carrier protein
MFSTAAAVLGSAGQSNHAAANAFMDGLAAYRRGRGEAGLSINWGAWAEVGQAASEAVKQRVEAAGMGQIEPAAGLRILEQLLSDETAGAQVAVIPIDWPRLLARFPAGCAPRIVSNFASERPGESRRDAAPTGDGAATDRAAVVTAQVASVLRIAPRMVDVNQPLNTMGLDSLMAMDLRNRIRSELRIEVPMVKFLTGLSVTALIGEIAAAERPGRAGQEQRDAAADLRGRLETLTDQEIDALLASTLAEDEEG